MQALEYTVTHQYQPSATSCGQTALTIALGYLDVSTSPTELLKAVPEAQDEHGKDIGTVNQQLATWCVKEGYKVAMYTFDCQIIDQSWATLDSELLITRLQAGIDGWEVPALGATWSNAYRRAYIDYLQAGGALTIQPAVTSKLLYELLEQGPIIPCVSYSTLHGTGRFNGETDQSDDVLGKAYNHTIVIHGITDEGNFIIADPLKEPGRHVVTPERMIAAISTAQIECDNLLFQVLKTD